MWISGKTWETKVDIEESVWKRYMCEGFWVDQVLCAVRRWEGTVVWWVWWMRGGIVVSLEGGVKDWRVRKRVLEWRRVVFTVNRGGGEGTSSNQRSLRGLVGFMYQVLKRERAVKEKTINSAASFRSR